MDDTYNDRLREALDRFDASKSKWVCPVCGSTDGRDAAQFFDRIDFTVSSCRNCKVIFALPVED